MLNEIPRIILCLAGISWTSRDNSNWWIGLLLMQLVLTVLQWMLLQCLAD